MCVQRSDDIVSGNQCNIQYIAYNNVCLLACVCVCDGSLLDRCEGTWGLAVINKDRPKEIVLACNGSPMVRLMCSSSPAASASVCVCVILEMGCCCVVLCWDVVCSHGVMVWCAVSR